MRRLSPFALLIALSAASPALAEDCRPPIGFDVVPLADGRIVEAVSDDGHVAGMTDDNDAVVWSPDGTPTVLQQRAVAEAISDNGRFVTGYTFLTGGGSIGTRWDRQTNSVIYLSPLPGHIGTSGLGVNDDGVVVGDSYGLGGRSSGAFSAVSWTGVVATDLGAALPANTPWSTSWDITNDGLVVGYRYEGSPADSRSWVWTPGGAAFPLPLGGFQTHEARAIADGPIAAGLVLDSQNRTSVATWTPQGMTVFPSSGDAVMGDVNSCGWVVGRDGLDPMLWTAQGAVPLRAISGLAGWSLMPLAISNNGHIVMEQDLTQSASDDAYYLLVPIR
jgi:uncharacterized membrane protein